MEDVRRHMDIRNRILAVYTKTEKDFDNKGQWDDYQETVEDLIYRIEFNIDVAEAEQQIADYQRFQSSAVKAATNAASSAADAGYMPASTGGPVLPVLRTSVTMDAEGCLQPIRQLTTREELAAAAAAGGWDPGIAVQRTLQDTFTTIFCF